ncbi:hypothetical protein KP509_20G087600 [Ceratopteris richardii]|uniref:Uncharacterized protein n=1 Tax=Ceratopteris richardii TaxID=49495 RepID=A0A8T2SKA9_CERRI|nr:hypothetical protein KP509_20G087600 [Ceratopteris richardii]
MGMKQLFLPGVCRVRPKKSIRIYNKIGRAYGFTIENSYIFDKEKGEGFFLSAVIYTNSNGILNDDKYEYETIADHVMADLGETMARLVWKISPSSDAEVPLCLDCIPSSSWDAMKLVDTKGIYATEDKTSVSSDEAIHSNKSMDAKFLSNVSEGTVSQWLYDSMDQKVPVSGVQLQLQAIKLCYKYFSSI